MDVDSVVVSVSGAVTGEYVVVVDSDVDVIVIVSVAVSQAGTPSHASYTQVSKPVTPGSGS